MLLLTQCFRATWRSVHMEACSIDEDFVGKLMDVMAMASNYSMSSQKVCERWLVFCDNLLPCV